MSSHQQFPLNKFYDALSNTIEMEKKLRFFINQYKNHNMHWVYQTVSIFQKILSSNKQLPIVKFNALLAIKNCFDTCQYSLITLIQVFLLNKITQIALFRSKIKDDSLMSTYFATEGYKEADHNDLKKISFNFVMLAIEFVFVSAQVKKFRCVENIQIKQVSKYAMNAQILTEKGIKRPQKFSFFLSDYVKDSSKKYQNKLNQFGDETCEIYSEYFLGIIIGQIQTGKKGHLQIRNLLLFGDAYLTSAMINLCEDELSSIEEGFQNKKKYLNLFNQFVRWGDIEAILMVNNSDFVTHISVNICTVRGDVNINQGQNIYPQIQGKKTEKKQFYCDFLRCIETWADCIPLNEQGLESNVRRIYIFLKEQKKFKFPENLVLKRYKKQLQQNVKKNQQRNQKLLQIINQIEQQEQNNDSENLADHIVSTTKKVKQAKKDEESINFEFLQNKIQNVEKILEEIVSMKQNDKQATKKLQQKFALLNEFNENWAEWLQKIDLQTQQIQQSDEQRLQQLIMNGEQTLEAVQIITPLIQMFNKNKINFDQFLKRIKQNLEIHQDLTISLSRRLDLTKSMGKSVKKDLSQTIQKSILKKSHKKVITQSKAYASKHQASNHLGASIYKSKALVNQKTNPENVNLGNSLFKSHHKSGLSSIRHSRIHQKLQRIKQNSSQIGQLIQSRDANFQGANLQTSNFKLQTNIQKKSLKNAAQSVQAYFQQNNSIGLKNQQHFRKEKQQSINFSNRSIEKQRISKNFQNRESLQSSTQNKLSDISQSPSSSKNFRSQKNITVVSRNHSQKQDVLERHSKKLVEDMDISDEADKIVVQYSDIDENQIEKKASEREKQQIFKNQQKKLKQKKPDEAFMKVKIEQKKVEVNRKEQKYKSQNISDNKNTRSVNNKEKIQTSSNKIIPPNEQKQAKNFQEKIIFKVESPIQKKVSSANRISNKAIPFDEDYGGKQKKITNKFDEASTPKRFEKIQKTKKLQSKISITSDDKNESVRSSMSIRQKIKNRISQKNSQISLRKSLLKDPRQERSLESQIRAMKIQEGSNHSRSLSRKKQGIRVTQINEKSILKMDCNQQYNYLPKKVLQDLQDSEDLSKTKKISQSKINLMGNNDFSQQNFNQRQQINANRNSRDVSSSSLGSRHHRQGISLSLGKRGSLLGNKNSLINRGSILRRKQPQMVNKQRQNDNDLRPEYFNQDIKKSKHSNRSRIKKRLNENRSQTQSDSSFGELIHQPNNRPMVQSHYSNKFPIGKSDKQGFKNYIANGLKQELLPGKIRQMDSLINNGSKKQQIKNVIQYNPNSRKAKSQQKMVYGSLLRDKYTQKQVSNMQSRLKALQQETKNMKTKLAVKDQQAKSFRNTSQKMQFSNPSESNYFTSSQGFKISRMASQKGNFSPVTHQFLKSEFQDSQLMKHTKSSQYNQYFEKVKGNTLKKTLLKSKCLIEKQDQIQIGCMSVRKQDFTLQITVFITPLRFDLTDINYAVIHDENISTQCHPKKVVNIEIKKQQKISIKMSVKRIPFSMIQFELTYKSKSEYSTNYFRLPIPILFNKFCQLQSVTTQSLESKLLLPDRAMVTSQFKLNSKVIKLEKIKQILPNFSYSKSKDFHLLTSYGIYKEVSFWLIVKIDGKNKAVIQGVMDQGQNFRILEFLMVTLKNIFESEK